jgi:hypothetical protein
MVFGFIKAILNERALFKGIRTQPGTAAAKLFWFVYSAGTDPASIKNYRHFLERRCGVDWDSYEDQVEEFLQSHEWGYWASEDIWPRGVCLEVANPQSSFTKVESCMFDLAAFIMDCNGISLNDDPAMKYKKSL